MYLVFGDECGYHKNWETPKAIQEQPFYVLAAVAIPHEVIPHIYVHIREHINGLHLPETDAAKLGKGEEIKAAPLDRGDDFWRRYDELRRHVRKAYLDHSCAKYFLVCINKDKHKQKYSCPQNPPMLAVEFLFERLQGLLNDSESSGFVFVDRNKREEKKQRTWLETLLNKGSSGQTLGKLSGAVYTWQLQFSRIGEVQFGDSKHSLDLQIADFLARHAYSWRKNGKKSNYPGWDYIEQRLYKYANYIGWGYKEFPEGDLE